MHIPSAHCVDSLTMETGRYRARDCLSLTGVTYYTQPRKVKKVEEQ